VSRWKRDELEIKIIFYRRAGGEGNGTKEGDSGTPREKWSGKGEAARGFTPSRVERATIGERGGKGCRESQEAPEGREGDVPYFLK